jgi:pimeloyl-ACP methyl ester carboxylesterase
MTVRFLFAILFTAAWHSVSASAAERSVTEVRSRDGTRIVYECAGSGPELLIVHGGTGDRNRWLPMFSYLEKDFTVCAMDRRAHGQSGDGPSYSLRHEAEDVAAVATSRGKPVAVLGHSFGGVVAYEAARTTPQISKLLLYEPPFRVDPHEATLSRMDQLIARGEHEAATLAFMGEVVRISPDELEAMRARPSWANLVSSIGSSIRQHRALASYQWSAAAARAFHTPTLLLIGSRTESPDLRWSVEQAAQTISASKVVMLQSQEHNAMDNDREQLAAAITAFVLPSN